MNIYRYIDKERCISDTYISPHIPPSPPLYLQHACVHIINHCCNCCNK